MENYFFEIPIYRCTLEQYHLELEELKEKCERLLAPTAELNPERFEGKVNIIYSRLSHLYDYNEAVGWIKLYILGNQIRGAYFFEADLKERQELKKRINKGIRKKRFEEFGKAFELTIRDENAEEISKLLLERLRRLNNNESPFKGRYIDTRQLENISNYIDWPKLISKLNPYNI